ncbi:MAG: hypothetical protein AAGD11_18660 [Planctomycetota bacterium]
MSASAALVEAALPIDLEVAQESGVPLTAPQSWASTLGRLDLGSVRLRSARGGERPQIKVTKLGSSNRYRVVGILTARNELVLPERRFRLNDRKGMETYFQRLPAQADHDQDERGRFGLTEAQFREIYAEFAKPTGFSTTEFGVAEIVRHAEQQLFSFVHSEGVTGLRSDRTLPVELHRLSLGTTLAYALRCEGLMLRPEQLPGESLRIVIEPYNAKRDSWPIGWKPAVSSRRSAPQLYEKRNIEIQGFTLSQALSALGPALQMPVVIDQWILRQQDIDPSQVDVVLPKKRTYLKSAVGKLLSQGRLAEEVRVDELDQPFLWVTRFGKNSPQATK